MPLHTLEHPISALFDIAHGAGMSIIIPAWLKTVSEQQPSRCAQLARCVFGVVEDDDAEAAERGRVALSNWFDSIGAPTSFSALDISREAVDNLIETAYEKNQMKHLGIHLSRDYFADVYDLAR